MRFCDSPNTRRAAILIYSGLKRLINGDNDYRGELLRMVVASGHLYSRFNPIQYFCLYRNRAQVWQLVRQVAQRSKALILDGFQKARPLTKPDSKPRDFLDSKSIVYNTRIYPPEPRDDAVALRQ